MFFQVGIAGYGVVGKSIARTFPDAKIYDKYTDRQDDLTDVDFLFVAVPTPWDGKTLDCSAVEDVIATHNPKLFVIRSATSVGLVDYLTKKYNKRIVVQPEYLGESPNHVMTQGGQPPFILVGGQPEDRRKVINLYATVYNSNVRIRQLSAIEAEVAKLSENRAVMFKVLQMQELYDACESHGLDYYAIREAVYGDDPRFDLGWSFVYPNKRGAQGKCLPKDIYAWAQWAESSGFSPELTNQLLAYNETLLKGQNL
jgi:UDP-glucose 6-dehydrogenase